MNSQLCKSGCCNLLLLFLCLVLCSLAFSQTAPGASGAAKTPEQTELDALNRQVVQLYNEKRFKDALPQAERALKMSEKVYGPEHEQTAKPLTNLAATNSALDKHGDAAKNYSRLLKLQEAQSGAESAEVAAILTKLGREEALSNDQGAAEKHFKRGLELREKLYGAEDKQVISALNDLASFKQRAGKNAEAVEYFKRVIALEEKHLGKDNMEVAAAMVRCAISLRQADHAAEADKYEGNARTIASLQPAHEPIDGTGMVLQGLAIFRLQPSYPSAAKSKHVQGAVKVQVLIDEVGIVTEAKAISGPEELRDISVQAAYEWRFKPTQVQGQFLKVRGILTFNFTMDGPR